jgi:hypothetical protein
MIDNYSNYSANMYYDLLQIMLAALHEKHGQQRCDNIYLEIRTSQDKSSAAQGGVDQKILQESLNKSKVKDIEASNR